MKLSINKVLFGLLSLPKTIYFNFKTFPVSIARKLPVIIAYDVKIAETHKGIIEFTPKVKKIRPGMVVFGYGGSRGQIPNHRGEICLQKGKLVLDGSMILGKGSSLRLNGNLFIGDNFKGNQNTFISCTSSSSKIGEDVMLGWNVAIRDSDGHTVYVDGTPKESIRPFSIGNHVWICAEAHILKGVIIGNDSIVAYRSTVTRSFPEERCLIGGYPACVIQRNVSWGDYIGGQEIE